MATHITWSIEARKNAEDRCPDCDGALILIVAPLFWDVDTEGREDGEETEVEVRDEVTGHYCDKCRKLCSLSLNTIE